MAISTLQKTVPALVSAVQKSSLKLKTYDLGFFKIHDTNGNQRLDPDQDKIEFHPEESKYFQHPLKKGTLGWVETYGKAAPAPYSAHIESFMKISGKEDYSTWPLSLLTWDVNVLMAERAARAGYTEATGRSIRRASEADTFDLDYLGYEPPIRRAYQNSINLYLQHAEKSAKAGRTPLAVQAITESFKLAAEFRTRVRGGCRIKIDLPKNLRPLVPRNIK